MQSFRGYWRPSVLFGGQRAGGLPLRTRGGATVPDSFTGAIACAFGFVQLWSRSLFLSLSLSLLIAF